MEIHAPKKHPESLGEILLHLAIVTVGILIALGLDQLVESYHHRRLVAGARETILEEVQENKREIENQIPKLSRFRDDTVQAVNFISDYVENGKSDIKTLHMSIAQAALRSSAWATAQTLGALSYMPYGDVANYASVYHLQDGYLTSQSRTQEMAISAYGFSALGKRFTKLSRTELQDTRRRLAEMVTSLTPETQLGNLLDRYYDNLLTGKPVAVRDTKK
jgi:hypothetical protein